MGFKREMTDTHGDRIVVERAIHGTGIDVDFHLPGQDTATMHFDHGRLLEFKKIIDAAYKELDV